MLSKIFRLFLCYKTIDSVPLFDGSISGLIAGQVLSMYGIIFLLSYTIVGIFYKKNDNPSIGSLLYFVVYCILLLITWLILLLLTHLQILPVSF